MMIRRSGFALVVLGVASLALGSRSAVAQPNPEPRSRPRFVGVPGHVINIDQVLYVNQYGQPGDKGRTEVYFTGAPMLLLSGDAGKQLIAALHDASLAPTPAPVPGPAARAEVPAPGAGSVAFDGFDGRFALNWKPVRPDPTHASLTRIPGYLTITTQFGSIHGTPDGNEAGAEFLARNLYLIDNPLAPDVDFTLTTRVTGFTPAQRYQQAGLIVYGDDDNYLKFGYEFNWPAEGGQAFYVVAEAAGRPTHFPGESESGLKDYWLRLTRRGNDYEYASSLDGQAWRVHRTATWAGTPGRVGLLAKNGGAQQVTEDDAHFDFFELRAAPARVDRPAAVEPPPRPTPPAPRVE